MEKPVAKQRNYYLDIYKIIAGILLLGTHTFVHIIGINGNTNGLWGDYIMPDGVAYFRGFSSLGIFLFTTGYWLMDAFQRYKKKGQLRKGHDFEICYRLTAKDYASYAPIICVATFIGFLHAHITIHSSIGDMITSFCWNLMSFLGLQGLAYHGTTGKFIMYTLSDGGSFAPTDIVAFQDTMWYLSAIVAFCCFFFVLLVISEKFTMFFAVPMVFILGNLTIDGGVTGFNAILPGSFSRLWSLSVIGMILWYVIEAGKNADWTEKRKKIAGWIHLTLFVIMIVMIIFGWPGGQKMMDIVTFTLMGLAIINQDWFSTSFNKMLGKVKPFSKHISSFGLGLIALQMIALVEGRKLWATGAYTATQMAWIVFGFDMLLALAWVPIMNFVCKPMTMGLTKLFGLNKPFGTMTVLNDAEAVITKEPAGKQ